MTNDDVSARQPGIGGGSVSVEIEGPVATVILSRPEVRNAVDHPTSVELHSAFVAIDRDPAIKAAVLWGAGGTFCAGADLGAISEGSRMNRVEEPTGEAHDPAPMGPTRMRLDTPVIAAVEGHAVAGGLELAAWCDLRVMASDAVFGVFCRRWGVPLVDGGTIRLPRLIGESRAMDLILTGRPVGADEAERIGLVNRVVEPGTARSAAEALAASIAGFPGLCVVSDRASVRAADGCGDAEALHREWGLGRATLESGEAAEGASRFAAGHGRSGRFDDL